VFLVNIFLCMYDLSARCSGWIIKLKTEQAMSMYRNIESRLRYQFCLGKAINIKYSECECVFLPYLSGMQSSLFCAVLYCHLWAAWIYHIFPHNLLKGMIGRRNLSNIKFVLTCSPQRLTNLLL
jgi:hypothetical protein